MAGEPFARGNRAPAAGDAQKVIDDLHRKIGQPEVEPGDSPAGQPAIRPIAGEAGDDRAGSGSRPASRGNARCSGIARSSSDYRPRPESAAELELLEAVFDRTFDRLSTADGSRRLQAWRCCGRGFRMGQPARPAAR